MPDIRQAVELKLKTVPESRKQFVASVLAQDEEVDKELIGLSNDIKKVVNQNSKSGFIQDYDTIESKLPKIIKLFGASLLTTMQKYNGKVAGIIAEEELVTILTTYAKVVGLSNTLRLFERQVSNYPLTVAQSLPYRRFAPGEIAVGERIKTITGSSLDVAKAIIQNGIKNGKSARQIAFELDNFVRPIETSIKPFDEIRKLLGREKVGMITRGEVRPGSVSYNSMRIARTEINLTYRKSVVDLHKDKPWTKSFTWNLSASHPEPDICDEWADGSPYQAGNLPDGHPHCLCFLTVDLVPIRKLK